MISAVSAAAASTRSTHATCAPSRANATAAALPLPQPGPDDPAPKTTAIFPFKRSTIGYPSCGYDRGRSDASVQGDPAADPKRVSTLSTSSHFGFLGCGGVGWLGWGRLRRCSAGRARWRPREGQGFQELGPGGEHNIGAQGLQVVEEAGSGPKRLAGVPPSA